LTCAIAGPPVTSAAIKISTKREFTAPPLWKAIKPNAMAACAMVSTRACSQKWGAKAFHDQGEMDKSQEHDVEFFESREDEAKAFESAKQSFDFVASSLYPGNMHSRCPA
jgi:hypothetical protein